MRKFAHMYLVMAVATTVVAATLAIRAEQAGAAPLRDPGESATCAAALSPEMALRFEKAFGISATTLVRMQATHDLVAAGAEAKDWPIKRLPMPARARADA